MESQLADDLDIEDDDVITDTPPPMPQHLGLGPCQGQSQPSARVFVEKSSEWRGRRRHPRTAFLLTSFLVCRAFPAHRLLGLEEDQRPDGQHGRPPAHPAASLDHQGHFCQSARRLQVGEVTHASEGEASPWRRR